MSFSFFRDRWNQGFYFKGFSNLGYVDTMPHYYKGAICFLSVPLEFHDRTDRWSVNVRRQVHHVSGEANYFNPVIPLLAPIIMFFFMNLHIPPFCRHEFWTGLVLARHDTEMKTVWCQLSVSSWFTFRADLGGLGFKRVTLPSLSHF